MERYKNAMGRVWSLVKNGDMGEVRHRISNWMYSESHYYGLERHADSIVKTPQPRTEIAVRPIQNADVDVLFDQAIAKAQGANQLELVRRQQFYQLGMGTCYVATTQAGKPAYMQWVLRAEDNDFIQSYFSGRFPVLKENEAMMEMLFTLTKFRRQRIMSAAVDRIARRVYDTGIERIVIFVGAGNVGSLKGCHRAGFRPFVMGTDRWRLFQRNISFGKIPPFAENLHVFRLPTDRGP